MILDRARRHRSAARRFLAVALVVSVMLGAIYEFTRGSVATNSVLSSASLNQPISADAMVVDASTGRIFIATAGLYASSPGPPGPPRSHLNILDARTGAPRQVKAFGTGLAVLALDERAGRVFLADSSVERPGGGTVYALDAMTGGLRAFEGRTGHLAVEGIGAPRFKPDVWAWVPPALRPMLPFIPPPPSAASMVLPSTSVTVLDLRHH